MLDMTNVNLSEIKEDQNVIKKNKSGTIMKL